MKKIILSLIISVLITLSVTSFAANESITVTVNGETLETPVAPQLVNNRTMLPMRAVFEKLGAKVTWFEENQIIFATKDDTFITLQIGTAQMSVQTTHTSSNTSVALDTAPYIYNNYTLIPIRAVAEVLQAKVEWINETQTVIITTE